MCAHAGEATCADVLTRLSYKGAGGAARSCIAGGRYALLAVDVQAWPIYAQGIARHFAQHLTEAEVMMLADVFARVLRTAPADPIMET